MRAIGLGGGGDSFVSVRAATSRGAKSEQRAKHYTLFYSSHSLSLSLSLSLALRSFLSASALSLRETFTATSISVRVKNRSSPASLASVGFASALHSLAFMAGQDWPIKDPDAAAPSSPKFGGCSPPHLSVIICRERGTYRQDGGKTFLSHMLL